MKTSSSFSITARVALGTLFFISGIALFCVIPFIGIHAQSPASGTVSPNPGGTTATWHGTATAPGGGVNTEAACVDGTNCEVFTLNVAAANWSGQKVQVQLTWASSLNEYDIYIHKGTLGGPLVTSATAGPGLTSQTANIDPNTSGTGVFIIHVVYDTTPNVTDHYTGIASAVPLVPVPPPAAPQNSEPKIGYENFEAPGVLTQVTQTSSGGLTVEWLGRGAGEPSVGSNWNTGVANFQSDLETLFITFDDTCPERASSATWVNRRAPTSQAIDSDPIGFTDRQTGRVFAAELTLLSPNTVKISHSDDDGVTWAPDQSGGIHSAVDHESIGSGPFHAPLTRPTGVPGLYPNAVYYCSQDIAAAFCARSDDGGSTYGPSVAIYNLTTCGGLHGHVKVSPVDGTVYVPNRQCGSTQAVVVSQDNGATWAIHPVQNGTTSSVPGTIGTGDDPAVGIDSNGRVYFAFSNAGTAAAVATSDDLGVTWNNIFNVGATFGINNAAFPAAVAGSATSGNPNSGRAAVAYYGSTAGIGDSNSSAFTGVWHLYVAHTFDGGAHWTTTDVTPNLPMQRSGIERGGAALTDRNLLDFFDITIDRDGRVLVGYVNGCSGGNCSQGALAADGSSAVNGNAYTATASIARQSSGRRMLAGKDPASPTSKPGMPFVTQRRIGNVVRLAWNEADTGNSPITSYKIFRGIASQGERAQPIATLPGTQNSYNDPTATDTTQTYYYKVLAVNAIGMSCGNNEVASPFVGDNCTGVIIHRNDPTHPEATGGSGMAPPVPELLIDYIAVGEPASSPGNLMFKMKVGDLSTIPPNSRWRIAWDWFNPATGDQMYYVGMNSDASSTVTFEYGTLADAGVPAILVLGETKLADIPIDPAGTHFNADGTITMFVPKAGVGNPQPGDLLGAIGGKTITGDTPQTRTFQRSTAFVDHTFIKGQADNSYPPATYTLAGNGFCNGGIGPIVAVSRKTHGLAGPFDVKLPLTGAAGIECRAGQGANSNSHQVVIKFAAPVTITSASVTPGSGKAASVSPGSFVNANPVTLNLTNVSDAQKLTINLIGVSDGTDTGNISIPMGVLLGDISGDGFVRTGDVGLVKAEVGNPVTQSNFRNDVAPDGFVRTGDVGITKAAVGNKLP